MIVVRQIDADPLAKRRRRGIDIHRDIPDVPGHDAHQFSLRLLALHVQPAQHVACRMRVVVLNELHIEPGICA